MNTRHRSDRFRSSRHPQRGLSYIEVLVATVLIVVALVPAMNALRSATSAGAVLQTEAVAAQRLRSKMEEVLAKPFAFLYAQTYLVGANTPTSVSDALSDPAGADRRLVVLYRYDGSSATAADTGLLRISVSDGTGAPALETLKGRWW